LEINRTTVDGWVMHVGEMLIPVREAMFVQTKEKRGSHQEGYLWQFGQPVGGRGREAAVRFLGQWEGKLQTDAYVGYEKVGGAK